MNPTKEEPLFAIGDVRITPGAENVLTPEEITIALYRHQHGDFGDLEAEDEHQNYRGLTTCGMIMSVHHTPSGADYWIQTHGTRSHTLILLPGE
jgi:hypothetical protein